MLNYIGKMKQNFKKILLQHGQMNQCDNFAEFELDFWLVLLVGVGVGPKGLAEAWMSGLV